MWKLMQQFWFSFLIFILPVITNLKATGINYCGTDICNSSEQHTLCKFQTNDPARHCIHYEKTINTAADKKAIVDKLNSRRNKIASGAIRSLPPAANMMKLEWNEELALSAQRWADQCLIRHVPDIEDVCRDIGNVYAGQNIATIYGKAPGLTPLALLDIWYMELLNFNATLLSTYRPSDETKMSHYDYFTQLAWATSIFVGCGGVKFEDSLKFSRKERKLWRTKLQGNVTCQSSNNVAISTLRIIHRYNEQNKTDNIKSTSIYRLVCNFAPGGNRMHKEIYKPGIPCSKCPNQGHCGSVHEALCSQIELNESTTVTLNHILDPIPGNINIGDTLEEPLNFSDSDNVDDESFTLFDYFTKSPEFVTPTLVTTTKPTSFCKNLYEMETFIELLKKKLILDSTFRELLHANKSSFEDFSNNDANVANFVNKIYSKKTPPTTTQLSSSEYINSTLLVNLVEAIVFRSKEKTESTIRTEFSNKYTDAGHVMLQAELAEVKSNPDFTGHYFFPEFIGMEETPNEDTTESYYDASNLPINDVELEIRDIKRNRGTKDFIEEILESESIESVEALPSFPIENTNDSYHDTATELIEVIAETTGLL